MQFIKTHLISLLCGFAAVVFVAIGMLGMTSNSVVQNMRARKAQLGADEISSLRSDPKNQELIDAKKREGELFQQEYQRTLAEAHRINRREPLMEGVFPKPASSVRAVEFRETYEKAFPRLVQRLIADTLPTAEDILAEAQNVAELQALLADQAAEGGQTAPAIQPEDLGGARFPTAPPEIMPGIPEFAGPRTFAGPRMAGPMAGLPMGGGSSTEPKFDPVYRARVSKARSIRCYVDEKTFHLSPIVTEVRPPSAESMWFAQAGLWIQQDVVEAVAKLNAEAADQLGDAEAYVEHMPVKRIVGVRVLWYELPSGHVPFPVIVEAGTTLGSLGSSFTGIKGGEQFDVVRFVLGVVVDQRHLLRLINQITKQNFYQCVNATFQTVAAEDAANGYLYGTAPVVQATLEFEGYMARAVYQPLMPAEVIKRLGGQREDD